MFLFEDKEFIGKKIKQLRVKSKLSQAELAEKIGMTEKNLSNIERGLQVPALNSFLKFIKLLNVHLSEFGIEAPKNENDTRNNLIKDIYLLSEKELCAYSSIVKAIKDLK